MSKTRVGVTVKNGNFEKALSIFKKEVKRTGILREYRDSQVYKKPSQIKNEKKREKLYNIQKNRKKIK